MFSNLHQIGGRQPVHPGPSDCAPKPSPTSGAPFKNRPPDQRTLELDDSHSLQVLLPPAGCRRP